MDITIGKLKLSAQRALLGNVSANLRAACVYFQDNIIHTTFYYDGEISEDSHELAESVLDEVIADFVFQKGENGKEFEFETLILRVDYPNPMPLNGHWVYYRHEL